MFPAHDRRMRKYLITLPLLLAGHQAAAASPAGTLTVEYTGYSHGLTVLKLAGSLTLTPASYAAHVTFHTAGMAAWVLRSDNDSHATGFFHGDQVTPSTFEGTGHLRDTTRLTRIIYVNGNPVVQALEPPQESERSPIPAGQTLHTIDTLSAVALLIHAVAETGHCDGSVMTFDGRRLASQTSHTTGTEILPKLDRTIFAGPALRCDFVGQQLGGFVRNEDAGELKKPRKGTAWLANLVPGAPPVPVRVAFDNKILGQVTLYLTSYSATAAISQK